jgi:hypothetical protein
LETHGIFRINGKRESRHAILDLVRGYNEEYKVKGKDAAPIDFTPYSVHDVATAFKVLLLRMNQTLLISFSLSLSLARTHTHSLSVVRCSSSHCDVTLTLCPETYLREQPDPIVPYDLRDKLISAWMADDALKTDVYRLLSTLPKEKWKMLRLILKFLVCGL